MGRKLRHTSAKLSGGIGSPCSPYFVRRARSQGRKMAVVSKGGNLGGGHPLSPLARLPGHPAAPAEHSVLGRLYPHTRIVTLGFALSTRACRSKGMAILRIHQGG